ncbi:class I SAM-dependent methyltransferase [Candidatus Pacearchaeota archaeon]|nr:class I SAM-dependent methyltransferase [Candidatus Pacearchaeota archaeon]
MKQDKKSEIELTQRGLSLDEAVKIEKNMAKNFENFDLYFNLFQEKIYPRKKDKIIDVCCGGGYFTSLIHKKHKNISGFDLSPFSIKIARTAFPKIKFFVSDAEKINLPSSSQDIIFVSNALHHFPDLTKVSKEFSRILKKNGKVFAIEPNLYNPITIFREFIGKIKGEKSKNEYPLSSSRVKKAFSKYFNVKISYFRLFTKLVIVMEKK